MFKKILGLLIAAIAVLAVVVSLRPDDFRVSRSLAFEAKPEVIFSEVNNLHHWEAWSPWAKKDPNAKMSYAGPDAGLGASFHWAGNADVGEGTMTITESRAPELVRFRLDFVKPFAGTNDAEFTFVPQGDKTLVTWTMSGKSNFIAKAIGLFIDCDKMVGADFEKGLANLKSIVDRPAQP